LRNRDIVITKGTAKADARPAHCSRSSSCCSFQFRCYVVKIVRGCVKATCCKKYQRKPIVQYRWLSTSSLSSTGAGANMIANTQSNGKKLTCLTYLKKSNPKTQLSWMALKQATHLKIPGTAAAAAAACLRSCRAARTWLRTMFHAIVITTWFSFEADKASQMPSDIR
jgi:hypothetical protein